MRTVAGATFVECDFYVSSCIPTTGHWDLSEQQQDGTG